MKKLSHGLISRREIINARQLYVIATRCLAFCAREVCIDPAYRPTLRAKRDATCVKYASVDMFKRLIVYKIPSTLNLKAACSVQFRLRVRVVNKMSYLRARLA